MSISFGSINRSLNTLSRGKDLDSASRCFLSSLPLISSSFTESSASMPNISVNHLDQFPICNRNYFLIFSIILQAQTNPRLLKCLIMKCNLPQQENENKNQQELVIYWNIAGRYGTHRIFKLCTRSEAQVPSWNRQNFRINDRI